ncbi:TPA: DUF2700 domain-containing protein, partial [Streptococcus suis]
METIKIILPVILVSLVAIFTINIVKKKSNNDSAKEKEKEENFMSEGMAIGMCLGTAVGIAFD